MDSLLWHLVVAGLVCAMPLTSADNVTEATIAEGTMPPDCSRFHELEPPVPVDPNALLKKCCPIGQHFMSHSNETRFCGDARENFFKVETVFARFFRGCIEDEEKNLTLGIRIVDKSEESMIYNAHYNDTLFIIQNGSLLTVSGGSKFFQVFNDYCLEYDTDEGMMTAFVWDNWPITGAFVSRAEIVIMAVCMFASVIFLGATIFIYASIRELRDLHGKSLICHASFLLAGYVLLVVVNLFDIQSQRIGYFIQFAILGCFFWMLVMCIDLCLHTWYYLPRGKRVVEEIESLHFAIYGVMAVVLPLVLVICTMASGIPGMPSYYLKATSSKLESNATSQAFFIPPICVVLIVSVGLMIANWVGCKRLQEMEANLFIEKKQKQDVTSDLLPKLDNCHIDKVRVMARSTSILLTIMTICWGLELITYFSGAGAITLLDAFNSLQGVFIFFVFVCLPRPRKLIKKWWVNQGSIDLQELEGGTELKTLQNGQAVS